MLKKFAAKFPIPATKFQKLEKEGDMQAGSVCLRQSLEAIAPFNPIQDSREAWLFRASRQTGINKTRLKSIFYNPQCRLWGDELRRIQLALSGASQTQSDQITEALTDHQAMVVQQGSLDQFKKEMKHEIREDIRALIVELLAPVLGISSQPDGKDPARH